MPSGTSSMSSRRSCPRQPVRTVRAILDGPGSAAFVAEEPGSISVSEQRTADRDERTMFPPARLMNQPGDDFLPCRSLR
jgi:hypothetical protein